MVETEDYFWLPRGEDLPPEADFCLTLDDDCMEPYLPCGQRICVQRSTGGLREFEAGLFYVDGKIYCRQWCVDYVGTLHLLCANPAREAQNLSIPRGSGRHVFCCGRVLLAQPLPRPQYL